MTKSVGIFLVMSGIIALFAGAFIEYNYGATTEITGRAVTDIVDTGAFSYLEAAVLSYFIISSIMGFVFLFRV